MIILLLLTFLFFFFRPVSAVSDRPFLIGWFASVNGQQKLAEFSQKGMNLVMPYHTESAGLNIIRGYLDEAQEQGIKVMLDLEDNSYRDGTRSFEQSIGWARSIVQNFKDHPAVYGWYLADEPELHQPQTSAENRIEYYQIIKSLDSQNYGAVVHWARPYSEYTEAYDILMNDWYPRDCKLPSTGKCSGSNDLGEFNYMVRYSYDIWKQGIAFARQNEKAGYIAVAWAQDYTRGNFKEGDRDLTRPEFRYHVYTALVQGVDGILFWWEPWSGNYVKDLVYGITKEIQSIGVQMNNGWTNNPQITVNQSADNLVYRYGVDGNSHVILAVNISGHSNNQNVRPETVGQKLTGVRFQLPANLSTNQVRVLNENRTIPVVNNSFVDNFERYQVHIYEFDFEPELIDEMDLAALLFSWNTLSSPKSELQVLLNSWTTR
ncbi:MAG: hypothetical protein ABIB61_00650 [Candidatus Shapirobacteria bacterium]